jgi:hypothetical protein
MRVNHNQHGVNDRTVTRRVVVTLCMLALCIGIAPHSGNAQTTEIENATNIRAQPLALLAKFPDAGPAMARFVADQLTQQPGSIDAMLSIVNDTSPQQASAMGAGMVRAVRALSTKNPAMARAISEKVMRADNKYLTTTYASLGPRYRGNVPFVAPGDVPPRELAAGDIGFGLGAAWRIGPGVGDNLTGYGANQNPNDVTQTCLYNSNGYYDDHCRGMIVAIIKSDASSNGAVSTSPTI